MMTESNWLETSSVRAMMHHLRHELRRPARRSAGASCGCSAWHVCATPGRSCRSRPAASSRDWSRTPTPTSRAGPRGRWWPRSTRGWGRGGVASTITSPVAARGGVAVRLAGGGGRHAPRTTSSSPCPSRMRRTKRCTRTSSRNRWTPGGGMRTCCARSSATRSARCRRGKFPAEVRGLAEACFDDATNYPLLADALADLGEEAAAATAARRGTSRAATSSIGSLGRG